jgi:hypothetical protein
MYLSQSRRSRLPRPLTPIPSMRTFRPENLATVISTVRPGGEVPILNEHYRDGGQCRIFKVDFPTKES